MRISLLAVLGVSLTLSSFAQNNQASPKSQERLQKEVRHELVMLPLLGVFDNLAYRVDGYNVTLMGQVTRPTLKTDAERVVKRIEGVETVNKSDRGSSGLSE